MMNTMMTIIMLGSNLISVKLFLNLDRSCFTIRLVAQLDESNDARFIISMRLSRGIGLMGASFFVEYF